MVRRFTSIMLAVASMIALPAHSALYSISFSTELTQTFVVAPFGQYTDDVVIRRGTIASGNFYFESEPSGVNSEFVGAPAIHLENYLFYNNDDAMSFYELNEGWSVTPTDWTIDLDNSSIQENSEGMIQFNLKAFRGIDMYSQNRPFHFAGDVGGTHDLKWINVGNVESTWRSSYYQDRVGAVAFSVNLIPEPGSIALVALGIIAALGAAYRNG